MRHDKLEMQLNLLLLLTENHNYTAQDVCDKMQISRRNFYYYLEFFRLAGFTVEHSKPYYRISKDSPFFRKLNETVHLTEDEAITMRRLLERVDDDDPHVRRLKQKLDKLYDLQILNNPQLRELAAHHVSQLYEAIKLHRCVVLKGYSSPHSNTQQDRVVEPFLLMNNNNEVRCFELKSGRNKTFKIARMQDVELLDVTWSNEQRHRQLFTDVFMFSDEQQFPVSLRLDRLAYQVMTEEYPQARRYISDEGQGRWLLQMPVCSYAGIGRFALGLFEHVEVLGDAGFKTYLKEQITLLTTQAI